jgi:hypothetical protein
LGDGVGFFGCFDGHGFGVLWVLKASERLSVNAWEGAVEMRIFLLFPTISKWGELIPTGVLLFHFIS